MANRDVWQGCSLSGTNHSRCVNSERRRKGSHLVTTCAVAMVVGKEGSRKPSLLGRKRHIELATKQQNVRN
ncbi:hypothetical protein H3S74_01800 [Gilliamella sp. W8126]|nr:hypothetical protein [Gilliamella sp. W8126]